MGIVLMAAIGAGLAVGAILTVIFGTAAVILLRRAQAGLGKRFASLLIALTFLLCAAVPYLPLQTVRPGSDYDIAFKNLFIEFASYALAPGLAALLAAIFVRVSFRGRTPLPAINPR